MILKEKLTFRPLDALLQWDLYAFGTYGIGTTPSKYPECRDPIYNGSFLYVCYQQDAKRNYKRNSKFGILHLYLLKTICEDRTFTGWRVHGAHRKTLYQLNKWNRTPIANPYENILQNSIELWLVFL